MRVNDIKLRAKYIVNQVLYNAIFPKSHDELSHLSNFCAQHGLHEPLVRGLVFLCNSPFTSSGEYRPVCLRLSSMLGIPLAELFPREVYEGARQEFRERALLWLWKGVLTSQQRRILKRHGIEGMSLAAVARELQVSRSRVGYLWMVIYHRVLGWVPRTEEVEAENPPN